MLSELGHFMQQRISGVQQEEALDCVWFAYPAMGLAVGLTKKSVDTDVAGLLRSRRDNACVQGAITRAWTSFSLYSAVMHGSQFWGSSQVWLKFWMFDSGGAAEVPDMQRMHGSMMRVLLNRISGAFVTQSIFKGFIKVSRGPGCRVGAAEVPHACEHETVRSGCTRRIRAWQSLSTALPLKRTAAI